MSNMVGGHLMAFASADNRSENGGRVGLPGGDRRNGKRIDESGQRLRPCSER
jgi:hypothetical protein